MKAKIVLAPQGTVLWTGRRFGLMTPAEIINVCFDAKELRMQWHHDITTAALAHPEVGGLFQLRLDQEMARRAMLQQQASVAKWQANKKLARKFVR